MKRTLTLFLIATMTFLFSGEAAASHALDRHWHKRSMAPITVYLVDKTAGRFPVRQAADAWTRSAQFDFRLVSACPVNRG